MILMERHSVCQQEGVSYSDAVIAVHKAGGKRTILKAMKNHPYDTKLQGCACNVLISQGALRKSDQRRDIHGRDNTSNDEAQG